MVPGERNLVAPATQLTQGSALPNCPVIGVVAPALAGGGGVPAVAHFLCEQIAQAGRFGLQLFSLATSARDELSLKLLAPSTWFRYPQTAVGQWEGRKIPAVYTTWGRE